jgi:hypothetical protein
MTNLLTAAKAALTVVVLAAGAATAQAQVISNIHGNTPPEFGAPIPNFEARAARAQASDGRHATVAQPGSTAVYANGKYIGSDPDVNVRMLLQKDFAHQ